MQSSRRSPSSIASGPRRGCVALLAVGIVLLCCLVPVSANEAAEYRGRLLVDVLQQFRDRGLDLIFSSAVVDEQLRVAAEPTASEPRAALEEILAPLGLVAEDGPGGSILILSRGAETGNLKGRVVSATRGTPIARATVRLPETGSATTTANDGSFNN